MDAHNHIIAFTFARYHKLTQWKGDSKSIFFSHIIKMEFVCHFFPLFDVECIVVISRGYNLSNVYFIQTRSFSLTLIRPHITIYQCFTFHLFLDDNTCLHWSRAIAYQVILSVLPQSRSHVNGSSENFSSYFLLFVHFIRFNCTFYQIYWHKQQKISTDKISLKRAQDSDVCVFVCQQRPNGMMAKTK